ncbi:MAG: hypothetical protein Q4D45_09890 [Lachnospiraceae bacterium]|nr:hypothetical protein [Lachnospiraceae bacterium]
MAIELVTEFKPYVDEMFATESKKSLLTNNDFDWTGAHTVKAYKVSTSEMNDYQRNPVAGFTGSRYGEIKDLDATTEEFTLKKDRSFTFVIDKLDADETKRQVSASSALARQQREVIIPEIDQYVYDVMCSGAGTKPTAIELTSENIYDEIIKASAVLDDAEVPDSSRYLVVTPQTLLLMKKNAIIESNNDVGKELRLKGVVSILDGLTVIKVPASRVPKGFGFMLAHPVATIAPTKLEDYKIHEDPPGISGSLVEGRIVYDAFVLDNKKKAIYYQAVTTA